MEGTPRTLLKMERAYFPESPYRNLPTKHLQWTIKWARKNYVALKHTDTLVLYYQLAYFVKIPIIFFPTFFPPNSHIDGSSASISLLLWSTSYALNIFYTHFFPSHPPSLTPMEILLHLRSISSLFLSVKVSRPVHFPVTSSNFPYLVFSHLFSCIFDTYINFNPTRRHWFCLQGTQLPGQETVLWA